MIASTPSALFFSGLRIGQLEKEELELVDACLAEVLPLLEKHGKRSQPGRSEMVEIGHSSSSKKAVIVDVDRCPCTQALIAETMRILPPPPPLLREEEEQEKEMTKMMNLNVIVRRYRRGEGLVFHVDYHDKASNAAKYHVYEEPVYGCVLENTSDSALMFKRGGGSSSRRAMTTTVQLPERKGTVFLQTGDARFLYQHGLLPLETGKRVSLTWRWVKTTAAAMAVACGHCSS